MGGASPTGRGDVVEQGAVGLGSNGDGEDVDAVAGEAGRLVDDIAVVAGAGFVAIGDPMVVTRSDGHRIVELNGRPAWEEYTDRLGLDASATCGDTIPIGALAEKLPDHLKYEYGNDHILRVVTKRSSSGVMY